MLLSFQIWQTTIPYHTIIIIIIIRRINYPLCYRNDNDCVYTDLAMETLVSGTKHRCRNSPFHIWTPMIPKMEKTKKHSIKMLPSIGNVSRSNVTRIRMPASSTFSTITVLTSALSSHVMRCYFNICNFRCIRPYPATLTSKRSVQRKLHCSHRTWLLQFSLLHLPQLKLINRQTR